MRVGEIDDLQTGQRAGTREDHSTSTLFVANADGSDDLLLEREALLVDTDEARARAKKEAKLIFAYFSRSYAY